ncbi:hypothetical protein OS493_009616 [Desmophyllum pertusum]|uniref:RNA helicase n=1 Tax=Desmophyllum pertusum TaxID=174260 RepID=A0A9W9YR54_9CNID|nr:hypothetical protein OS493_009616 [Desmophyllum pertusum]
MQSVILKRIGLQRLFRNNFHLRYADFYNARCFASQRRETFGGVTGIKRVAGIKRGTYAKKKRKYDPDEEFMQLWSTSEGYIKNMFQEAKRETSNNTPMRKYGNTFMTQNVSTLPLASELTKDEIEQLPEDSGSVDFRIPDAEDFAGLTPEYKSLKEQELKDDEVVELRNVDDKERDKNQAEAESDVVDTSKILSFQDFDLHPKLIEKLTRDGITVPTAIQKQAIPLILKRKSILIQSETGSGKTLYPGKAFGTLIIVPTRELASQMLYEARRFLGDKTIVESFVSGVDVSKQEARLKDNTKRPWIVIGTPKRILEIVEKDPTLMYRTKRIVIDEVDKTLLPLKERRHSRSSLTERTIPDQRRCWWRRSTSSPGSDRNWLGDHVTVIQSPTLEGKRRNVPPCIKHQYVICDDSFGITKAQALARIFRNSGQNSALVFIHRLQSVDTFVWELRDLGINAVALYQKVANQDHEQHKQFLSQFRTGEINVVVGTEETVRGLDFKELDHVYLTEVAKNIDEYLHLAGRVGRQERPGTATTLVSPRDPRDHVRVKLVYRRLGLPFEQIML